MRKKLQAACIVVGMSILLTGCAFQETSSEQETYGKENNVVDINSTTEGKAENAVTSSPAFSDIPEFSGELDFEYVYGTDAQTEIGSYAACVYTEDGKYFAEMLDDYSGSRLLFYDNASGQTVPVCSKSNCAHNAEGCDAFFAEEIYFSPITMWYYEDNLYMPMLDGDYIYLEKISPDGSTREKAGTICRMETEITINEDGSQYSRRRWPGGQLHRGYFYFTTFIPGDESINLYRVKLGSNEEPEVLYTLNGNEPWLLRIKPYGRYVLFQITTLNNETQTYDGTICAYDTDTGSISRLCDNVIREFIVMQNCLYYCDTKDNVYCKDLDTKNTSLFYETNEDMDLYSVEMFSTEDGLVYQLTNVAFGAVEKQYVLSLDGTVKKQIVVDIDTEDVEEQKKELVRPYSFVGTK